MTRTIAAVAESELLIRRSRFLGRVEPVSGRTEAVEVVAALRATHPDAAHVCWALLAGGESAAVDDGEPSGTAARPMMEVLRRNDLDGVLATVVRYFGGVRLGAGGLVRAYSGAVAEALRGATLVPMRRMRAMRVTVPYAVEGAVRRELAAAGAVLGDATHGSDVTLDLVVDEDDAPVVAARVDDVAGGRARWGTPGA